MDRIFQAGFKIVRIWSVFQSSPDFIFALKDDDQDFKKKFSEFHLEKNKDFFLNLKGKNFLEKIFQRKYSKENALVEIDLSEGFETKFE